MTDNNISSKPLEFPERKAIGQTSERLFIQRIALMGGAAQTLGLVPQSYDQTPRFCRPHATAEEGFHYSVSPDVLFTLPNKPKGFASLAQIKLKKLYSDPSRGELFIYLDEVEVHRMKVANQFYDVYFVIQVPELDGIAPYGEWLWIKADFFNQKRLIKRIVNGKKTLVIPLDVFSPLAELIREELNEPGNSNYSPKAITV